MLKFISKDLVESVANTDGWVRSVPFVQDIFLDFLNKCELRGDGWIAKVFTYSFDEFAMYITLELISGNPRTEGKCEFRFGEKRGLSYYYELVGGNTIKLDSVKKERMLGLIHHLGYF